MDGIVFKYRGNEYTLVKSDDGQYGVVNITQERLIEPGYDTEATLHFLIWAIYRLNSKNERLANEVDILQHSLRNFEQWHNAI